MPRRACLELGQVYRYGRGVDVDRPVVGGLPNFHHVTSSPPKLRVSLERGINPIKATGSGVDLRRPAVCIRTSPGKAGTSTIPWHDVFDLAAGRAIYFGDHKPTET